MDAKELGAQPAFPGFDYLAQDGKQNPPGLTLRQHFAGLAMQTVLANVTEFPDENWRVGVAMDAVLMADALLAALAKQEAA